jgi:small subunit ribosomal protein S4
MVNGEVVNIPSYTLKPGDVIELKPKSKANVTVIGMIRGKNTRINWVEWNEKDMKGTYLAHPEREAVPENIKEQLIVELYSK